MKKEQDIQSQILKYIKSVGGLPFKQNQIGIYAEAGVPDILVCYKGRFIAFEVKKPKQYLKPIQDAYIKAINSIGGYAYRVDNVATVEQILKDIDKKIEP